MFTPVTLSGPPLHTIPSQGSIGKFQLKGTNHVVANTLRRCILTQTRSVSFRADLTNQADPGVKITKNTSVLFNEMLAHRLTLLPLGVVRIDDFDPERYECILKARNDTKGPIHTDSLLHVKAGDFRVHERQENGEFAEVGSGPLAALFPVNPLTKDTALLLTLRSHWNPEQPPEEIELVAKPVIGKGADFMGFCPVSQCSFGNTPDPDPVRREQFFAEWLAAYKKIADPTTVAPDVVENHRAEWNTMAQQRCFLIDEKGEPNSFDFTVESVGMRPVSDIVAEGIRAVIELVRPFTDEASTELGITVQPVDSRMNGVDVIIEGHEHTLGALLQSFITDIYLDATDSPVTFVGYKVKHPLHRSVMIRLGIREGLAGDGVARQVIAAAASKALALFEELSRSWTSSSGPASASASASATGPAPPLEGAETKEE
jgi:DNA-directed RNA polymerase subunit L